MNPKGWHSEYKIYMRKDNILKGFDPNKIKINDILIFDSINQSLILYALKYDIKFYIFATKLPNTATSKLIEFTNFLLSKEALFFI